MAQEHSGAVPEEWGCCPFVMTSCDGFEKTNVKGGREERPGICGLSLDEVGGWLRGEGSAGEADGGAVGLVGVGYGCGEWGTRRHWQFLGWPLSAGEWAVALEGVLVLLWREKSRDTFPQHAAVSLLSALLHT